MRRERLEGFKDPDSPPLPHKREFRERRNNLRRMGSVKEGFTMKGIGNGKNTTLEKLNLSSLLTG